MKLPDEETLAEEFRIVMNEQLGPRTRAKIDRLNALEPNSGVCHSHDFIDANSTGRQTDPERTPASPMRWPINGALSSSASVTLSDSQ